MGRRQPSAQWRAIVTAVSELQAAGCRSAEIAFDGTPHELASVSCGEWITHLYDDADSQWAIDSYVAQVAKGFSVRPTRLSRRAATPDEIVALEAAPTIAHTRSLTVGGVL